MIDRAHQSIQAILWDPRIESSNWLVRSGARMLRFPYALIRDGLEGEVTLRAMSLVYTTLLAIVPLLAFSFSVLKAFGYHKRIEPLLFQFLGPLGEEGAKLTTQIIGFVENVPGVPLGSLGLALLLYTVISMVQKIEESFNFVWQVQRTRSIGRRFSEYLSVILIAPVLLAAALGLKSAFENTSLVRGLLDITVINDSSLIAGQFMPFILIIAAFSFLYGFVPNTTVYLRSALIGGVAGGLTWSLLGAGFGSFVSASTKYQAIYSSFAIPLLALIWLYISWLVVLLGARVSYYYQHPEYLRRGRRRVHLTNRLRERLALAVMYFVGAEFRNDRPHWTHNTLATSLGVPADTLGEVIRPLEAQHLLVVTEDDLLMPGRDTDCIKVTDIVDAIRRDHSDKETQRKTTVQRVEDILTEMDSAVRAQLGDRTLKDIIEITASDDKNQGVENASVKVA